MTPEAIAGFAALTRQISEGLERFKEAMADAGRHLSRYFARRAERRAARCHQPIPLRIDGAAYHRRRKARTRRNR